MKRIIWSLAALICLSAVLILSHRLALPQNLSVVSKCPEKVVAPLNGTIEQVHPYKVVVKPWWGRHHVYGIFALPEEYKASNLVMVTVQGAGTYCGPVVVPGEVFQGIYAKPGERLVVGYLRTRTTVWLIFRGFIDQLKELQNWTLRI